MILESQKSYLHEITGGFDNEKRREIRKLFAATIATTPIIEEKVEAEAEAEAKVEPDMKNADIAVGILEEFFFIGVNTFTLDQAVSVVAIFKLGERFHQQPRSIVETLRNHFNSPRFRIASPGRDTWTVPTEQIIEKLKNQYCELVGSSADSDEPPWRDMGRK